MLSFLAAGIALYGKFQNGLAEAREPAQKSEVATNPIGTVRFVTEASCLEAQIDNRTGQLSEAKRVEDCGQASQSKDGQSRYSPSRRVNAIRDSFSGRGSNP